MGARPAGRSLRDVGTCHDLRGRIAATGFASGDRLVVGMWEASPIGPFADVMWAQPDGVRRLYAAAAPARFITAVYGFDEVCEVDVRARRDGPVVEVSFGPWELRLTCGRAVPFPPRPAWVTRHVERPLARRLMAVETYGVSPTGVEEWYRASAVRRIRHATMRGPAELGAMAAVSPRCGFGFSEPPRFPSCTDVRPRLRDRSGALDRVLASLVP